MARAPTADSSRERTISSEPRLTRPNPFDDDDSSLSRKRRRTSGASGSRSLSVETPYSSPDSPATGMSAPELRTGSAMKLDSESRDPATPGPPPLDIQPASESRSSRVTINVRTPSQHLEAIPSAPPSPSPGDAAPPPAASPADPVKAGVKEPGTAMQANGTAVDTPAPSRSYSRSPPIEVITVDEDDDGEFNDIDFNDDDSITMLDESDRFLGYDPTHAFPFHDTSESYIDTTARLLQYFPTHDQVPRAFVEWIDKYLAYVKTASIRVVDETYYSYREVWQSVPQLPLHMVNRKCAYPRSKDLRQDIFAFYRSFAQVAVLFTELDLRVLKHPALPDQDRLQALASPSYLQALGALTRREEVVLHATSLRNGDESWSYVSEVAAILETFQNFPTVQGGSLMVIRQVAMAELRLVSQCPKPVTEHLGNLCLIAGNVLKYVFRGAIEAGQQPTELAKRTVARMYPLFTNMATMLSDMIDKNLNQLSPEGVGNLIEGLTEIYHACLLLTNAVPLEIVNQHLQGLPPVAQHQVPEAVAYHWKFSQFVKLIRSGQMQLRVMAVSTMCTDLVALYRRYGEGTVGEVNNSLLLFMAEFLVRTGLVNYILGATCHPEITLESSNIIGFLVATGTYDRAHTDALWQTVMSTQDPRVSDALVRMVGRIANLFGENSLLYFLEKLNTVPVEVFGPTTREFCDQVIKQFLHRFPETLLTESAPFDLCIRLIRQSSALGPQSPVAYPDIQQFAIQKLDNISSQALSPDVRWAIYRNCLGDIAEPSPSAIGSLWVLNMALRFQRAPDLHELASEHDLTRLLIDELAAAIPTARAANFPAVISGAQNVPRKELLMSLIFQESTSITKYLGARLWELLVGSQAACQEDRDVSWHILAAALKRSQGHNPFASTCFTEYLPGLDPEFFCEGTLDFVREGIMPLVNEPTSVVLDDDENPTHSAIEKLWRIVLTAPAGTVENRAIDVLVRDIYIGSRCIQTFSPYRARKVHLSLVRRCLRQLSSAVSRLRALADGSTSGDDDSMVVVATEQQIREQELLFIRSLAVLREFHHLYQARPEFSAPDMRSLTLEPPRDVEGESAELKYQSFDGDIQTTVMPLNIGKRNTAASLLASLRQATGFESYRIYYRGRPFVPQERDICKSLEDLQIHNGIILVKREAEEAPASPRVPQGASPVEVEILGHFDELWEYLSMDEKLAREMYGFLVKLPADEKVLRALHDPSLSYIDTFPLGQPFKSLYAAYALHQYLGPWQTTPPVSAANEQDDGQDDELADEQADGQAVEQAVEQAVDQADEQVAEQADAQADETDELLSPRAVSLIRALSLVVMAIADPKVIARCPTPELQLELGSALMQLFVSLLTDLELPPPAAHFLDGPLLDRLLALLSVAASANTPQSAAKHVPLCLQSLLEPCCVSDAFMAAFSAHPEVPRIFGDLLLNDSRAAIRQTTAMAIREKTSIVAEGESLPPTSPRHPATRFRSFFWPLISRLVRPAVANPGNAAETIDLCFDMLLNLEEAQFEPLNIEQLSNDWINLLLDYTTSEDPTRPAQTDMVGFCLIRLVHAVVCNSSQRAGGDILLARGVGRKIFWKHLFPPRDETAREFGLSRPIASPQPRSFLMEIVFTLVKNDPTQFMWLLEDLDDLVPVYPSQEGDFYAYDLPQQFERAKSIRAPCGYAGLRNLSNTCYFNSLFTQLFMNVDFRKFMLGATVRDRQYSQSLLFQTQRLFAQLQDSVRPFINPEECVASIKTYDDTQIDVVIQMDVDEFYNLLFDRWEGQFLIPEEKNQFRSFFGGQLVQQVRSQECEHVSERLEPFSAIQCDIKGKSSLQESLQAYVDGEIMEGDNKYKCSTCDRHVDAVKRACLKDIPDNLIFHLKRFDFNLRTMQRNKINDCFAFPEKIDMRPYTIDHLSDSAEGTSEDVFELVGVLVHTGTAESGHYYSYIRERPTNGDAQTWVEFNDELVSPWDPASMANACFGGADTQLPATNGGFEKQYSAYMLFYQRSSSLVRDQAALQHQAISAPLRAPMPEDVQEWINDDNAWLLRRHCLFDPTQIQFVSLALSQLKNLHSGGCSRDHVLESQALTMALSHLDQVASRAKDTPDFRVLLERITSMCDSCAHCSLIVHGYFTRYTFALRMLLQRNIDEDVRRATAEFLIHVLAQIKKRLPAQYGIPDPEEELDDFNPQPTTIAGAVRVLEHLWQGFHMNLRSWHEVFDFMLSFVKMGRYELAAFLEQPQFLKWLLWIVWADTNAEPFLSAQFAKMVTMVSRRLPNRPPSYETIIALLDYLLANVRLLYTASGHATGVPSARERIRLNSSLDEPFIVTKAESEILHQMGPRTIHVNVFIDRLVTIDQNPAATNSIVANLMKQSRQMENCVFHTLLHRITGQAGHPVAPYLRLAGTVFCRIASDPVMIGNLMSHVSQQCMGLQHAEGKAFLEFLRETFDGPRERSGETAYHILMANLDRVPDWAPGLLSYFDGSVVEGTEMFLQERIFQHRNFQPSASDNGEEADEAQEVAEKMRQVARVLGIRCLLYLRENYVLRKTEVTERAVGGLQRVVKHCSKYFDLKEPAEDEEAPGFMELSQTVLESVANLMVVDDLEEDGSDWESSSMCSGQLDLDPDLAHLTNEELLRGEDEV